MKDYKKELKDKYKDIIISNDYSKWDYLHLEDLLQAFYLIGSKGKRNLVYPVGSGDVRSLSEYVLSIGRVLNKTELIGIGEIPYKNNFIDNSVPDISELLNIGYKSNCKFDEKILDIINLSSLSLTRISASTREPAFFSRTIFSPSSISR